MKNNNKATEEQIRYENQIQGLPIGLYHNMTISDGSRTIELTTPAHTMDLNIFIDMAMYSLFVVQNDDLLKTLKNEYLGNFKKNADNKEKDV